MNLSNAYRKESVLEELREEQRDLKAKMELIEEENKILKERNREYLLKLEKEANKQFIDRGNIQAWNRGLPFEGTLFTDTQNSNEEEGLINIDDYTRSSS